MTINKRKNCSLDRAYKLGTEDRESSTKGPAINIHHKTSDKLDGFDSSSLIAVATTKTYCNHLMPVTITE